MTVSLPKPTPAKTATAQARYLLAPGGLLAFGAVTFFCLSSSVLPYRKTELISPGAAGLINRFPVYVVTFVFVLIASIILTGSLPLLFNVLVGLAGLWAGQLLAPGLNISDFNAPLPVFYWLSIPIWAVLQVTAQALWPVNLQPRGSTGKRLSPTGLDQGLAPTMASRAER